MKRFLPLSALGLLVACGIGTEPLCGCSLPGPPSVIVTGVVTDPASVPVRDAAVKMRLLDDLSCEEREGAPTGTLRSGAGGRFRVTAGIAPGPACFRLWAEPPQGSAHSDSESRVVQAHRREGGATPDSLDVVLRLR